MTLPKPLLVAIPLLALLVGGGMWMSQQMTVLQRRLIGAQRELTLVTGERDQLAAQLEELTQVRRTLEERLTSTRQELTRATEEWNRTQLALEAAETAATDLEARQATLREELAKWREQAATAEAARDDLDQTAARLRRQVTGLTNRLQLAEREVDRLKQQIASEPPGHVGPPGGPSLVSVPAPGGAGGSGVASPSLIPGTVELPPIVVTSEYATVPQLIGRVVEINGPHGFCVLDKGTTDGLRLGMVFDLLRGGGRIGQARVIRLRPSFAACELLGHTQTEPAQVGDLAVQHGL